MTPKSRFILTDRDDLAWEKSDEQVEAWERSLNKSEVYRGIANLILEYRPGETVELHRPIRGGYNVFYRLEYKDGSSAGMRVPCKGIVKFPEEKVRYEVATMRYVAAKTTISVPKIYHYGTAEENPLGLGPFIIMEYIDHERTLSDALNDPLCGSGEPHVLNKDIDEQKLRYLYAQMANIVLQLSTLEFSRMGSLVQDEDGNIDVGGRPLIQNMNSLVEFASVPPKLLLSEQFLTSTQWYSALADMHRLQATLQRNDAVSDEDDARDKFVARQLFQRLAKKGRLATEFESENQESLESTFRLYSEDLRPSNILINKDLRVVGVIDWEYAYVAPAEFSFVPPWWLLLKCPEDWPGGYKSWTEACEPRIKTFLSVLEEEEDKMRDAGPDSGMSSRPQGEVRLSQRMRKRWESKTWLINYAAKNSWAFDFIYWRFLDTRFHGENERQDHRSRLGLLSEQETTAMENFVDLKMRQAKTRALVDWNEAYEDDAAAKMKRVMI